MKKSGKGMHIKQLGNHFSGKKRQETTESSATKLNLKPASSNRV